MLLSLAAGKVRVLEKSSEAKEVLETDTFSFCADFKAKLNRLRMINSVQLKETSEEHAATNKKVINDRQYQIEAAIVRIMKTRKTLTHQLLVAEVFSQLKFSIALPDLKKRIESLIERDYLERDEHNLQVYNYVA